MSKKHEFDAVIFDLDGVVTKTASVHSTAWTRMFNDYLNYREATFNEKHREFTNEDDYLPYVDGKPRYKGVADFLASRKIDIPFGDPDDSPEKETACGLGNRKNKYFTEILKNDGVEEYESTVSLIKELKEEGIRVGVASSSKNCKMVLETIGLLELFETRVDGIVSAELGLKGKPEPDIFTTACDNLGVKYDRSVIVEDAVSGVQAGEAGGFGLTIGLARDNNIEELRKNGADIVFEDISEMGGIKRINSWFKHEVEKMKWGLKYNDYVPEKEKSREALLTTGNGFFATRGSMEELSAGDYNYPASYMAGLFNKRKSSVGNKTIENEDSVNFVNWIPVNFRPKGGEWFDPNRHEILSFDRYLDFHTGVLNRTIVVKHPDGKESKIESRRFVSMADPHLAGLEYSVTPLNYSGEIEMYSMLDSLLINDGVERYRDLDQNHLEHTGQGQKNGMAYINVRTNQSHTSISIAEKLIFKVRGEDIKQDDFVVSSGKVKTVFNVKAGKNEKLILQKIVSIHNSRDFNQEDPLESAMSKLAAISNFDAILADSSRSWAEIWKKADLKIEGDRYSQKLIRLHIYHLIVTSSSFNKDLDVGIPARGLHGEAYRGHIFWDELYIFPWYISHFPENAKSSLMYRYRRLNEARKYAKQHNYEGAMFPWQSGSSGEEETQVLHLNPVSGEWGDDYSSLQRHISIAIAYNIWEYYHISGDQVFMNEYGAEMFLEICRFWASKADFNESTGRYSIKKVMGPDEFHEKLPESTGGGLTDNAYTNLMVVWCMKQAFKIIDNMGDEKRKTLRDKIFLQEAELEKWKDMTERMNILFNEDKVMEQFQGYFNLKELDWDHYNAKYDDIHRMDRILKAEGKSPDDYKVAKQADTLMLFYLLGTEEVKKLLNGLSYDVPEDFLKLNFDYYIKRTSHGSTLSRVVHAYLSEKIGQRELCKDLFMEALASDYNDVQGGTTSEGIHVGVMGGTVLTAISMFGGLSWDDEMLILNPDLPDHWHQMDFNFLFKEDWYEFRISKKKIQLNVVLKNKDEVKVKVNGDIHIIKDNIAIERK